MMVPGDRNYRICEICGKSKTTPHFNYYGKGTDDRRSAYSKVCKECEQDDIDFKLTVTMLPFSAELTEALQHLPTANRHLVTMRRYVGSGYFV